MAVTGQGTSFQGVTLTYGNAYVTSSDGKQNDGVFLDPKAIECFEDGDISILWYKGATPQVVSLTTGWVNPIICESVTIVSGTWNIDYWN